jgi:hypothetical protein
MLITFRHEPHRNTIYIAIVQQYHDRCMRIRCHGNPFTEQLPSDSPGIVVFPGRYQATHVPSRDRCIATTRHAIIPTIWRIMLPLRQYPQCRFYTTLNYIALNVG